MLQLDARVADRKAFENSVRHLKDLAVVLPRFSELADPRGISKTILEALGDVHPQEPHPLNLFRVHWFNSSHEGLSDVPEHLTLPESLTGVPARIVIALGNRFPMIRAHKVLAAYGCLAPRLVTGRFDPTVHRAVWPSTGNYCRGGVAISRIMGCRGVAVLPEGMSEERFRWLERWVSHPEDIIKTPGTESNVKEIYDACAELSRDPENVILNQFSEFGNYLVHFACTGRALEILLEGMQKAEPGLSLSAFVAASGSAGTLGAGDYLKERHGSAILVAEALECPTLLYGGFGAHNIQGIGDKHVPYIHNVMNTDFVAGISDQSTDALDLLFNCDVGRAYLRDRRKVPAPIVEALANLGYSGICNVLASIKLAKRQGLGPNDVVMTVATDDAAMYAAERAKFASKRFPKGFDEVHAGEVFGEHLLGAKTDHLMELGRVERERIFNLGYYTWVEQQGVSVEDFSSRKDPAFWVGLRDRIKEWDALIDAFNRETGVFRKRG